MSALRPREFAAEILKFTRAFAWPHPACGGKFAGDFARARTEIGATCGDLRHETFSNRCRVCGLQAGVMRIK
jgi:hypothetical protein